MKVYIWGIGRKCKDLLICGAIDKKKIFGFLETKKSEDSFEGKKVYELSEIEKNSYIIVTIKRNRSIYELCKKNNVDLNNVCFVYPCLYELNMDKNLEIAKITMSEIGYRIVCEHYGLKDENWIIRDAEKYSKVNKRINFNIEDENNYFISSEKYECAGSITSYFWQDLWAAKKIIKECPKTHYDIGSRVDGFIAHLLAADINVNLIDIRPMDVEIENLFFTCADATNMDNILDESIESLSALCSLEHFGLGRYGDPIDPEACFKAFSAIQRKMMSGGNIYIAVPIGYEHLEFNAHRVFFTKTIIECFSNCELIEFSSTKNDLYEQNIDIHKYDTDKSLGGLRFGLFHFIKK